MRWRFYRAMAVLGVAYFSHGLHVIQYAPQTFDDPHFVGKMITVVLAATTAVIAHQVHKAEAKLKSTQN